MTCKGLAIGEGSPVCCYPIRLTGQGQGLMAGGGRGREGGRGHKGDGSGAGPGNKGRTQGRAHRHTMGHEGVGVHEGDKLVQQVGLALEELRC